MHSNNKELRFNTIDKSCKMFLQFMIMI